MHADADLALHHVLGRSKLQTGLYIRVFFLLLLCSFIVANHVVLQYVIYVGSLSSIQQLPKWIG
jgi:hypothetical protein